MQILGSEGPTVSEPGKREPRLWEGRRTGTGTASRWSVRSGLLIQWPTEAAEPTKDWLATLSRRALLVGVVRLAKARWRVEQSPEQLKGELGLDHFEGRSWLKWHHHVTMTMVAYVASPSASTSAAASLIGKDTGPTIPQARAELQYLLTTWGGILVRGRPVPGPIHNRS